MLILLWLNNLWWLGSHLLRQLTRHLAKPSRSLSHAAQSKEAHFPFQDVTSQWQGRSHWPAHIYWFCPACCSSQSSAPSPALGLCTPLFHLPRVSLKRLWGCHCLSTQACAKMVFSEKKSLPVSLSKSHSFHPLCNFYFSSQNTSSANVASHVCQCIVCLYRLSLQKVNSIKTRVTMSASFTGLPPLPLTPSQTQQGFN